MKKDLKATIAMSAVLASFLGVVQTLDGSEDVSNSLLAENVEALANGPDNNPWAECPQDKWIRNAKESWKEVSPSYDSEIGFYVTIPFTDIKVGLGADANAGGTALVPTCVKSNDNCCEKAHLNKSPRYL